ncbi:MAG: hypothetical protein V4726_09040 [Verrucomicrobiota bacterium]
MNFQQEMLNPVTVVPAALSGWRRDAARLAAELLCEVTPGAADEVLDLRSALLDNSMTPGGVLRAFFAARNRLESEHYLLFFRLRRVLEPALGVEVAVPGGDKNRMAVDFRHRDVRHLIRGLRRERFEHDLNVRNPEEVAVRVVWRFAPEPEALTA